MLIVSIQRQSQMCTYVLDLTCLSEVISFWFLKNVVSSLNRNFVVDFSLCSASQVAERKVCSEGVENHLLSGLCQHCYHLSDLHSVERRKLDSLRECELCSPL